jgi:hypothetical protein
MKEKILAHLKNRLPGVSNSYLDGVAESFSKTITEESQIETVISDGVISSLKYSASFMQTEGDRRATEATTNAVKTYEQKHNLKDGKPIETGGGGGGGDDKNKSKDDLQSIVANAVKAAVEPLQQKLEGYEKAEASKVNRQKLVDKLEEEGITEKDITAFNLLAGVTVEKEDELDSKVATIKEQFTTQKQVLIDEGKLADTPASGSKPPGEMKSEDYQKIMDGGESKEPGAVDLGLTKS